jgi:acetyl esterase/lipase
MWRGELDADQIGRLIDREISLQIGQTLPASLPDGPLSVAEVRAVDDLLQSGQVDETAQIVFIAGPAGGDLALRVHDAPGDAAILWIHGGGHFLGAARRDDAVCLALSSQQGVAVIAVDYRLAPEHPYPAAIDDCYVALEWAAEHFGRVVVVGESAGGGLAAGLALLTRDRGGPRVTAQVLHYPMLDDRGETASAHALAETAVWNRRLNELGWRSYLGDRPADQYAAPARAGELGGLPPTYLDVGELDLFRDEVIAFGARLAAACVSVELHVDPGAVHGFDRVAPDAQISRIARERRGRFLARALAPDACPVEAGARP